MNIYIYIYNIYILNLYIPIDKLDLEINNFNELLIT